MKTTSVKTAKDPRLVVRPDEDSHKLIARAAELSGRSVNQFLLYAATKEARKVEKRAAQVVVSQEAANRMLDMLDNPQPLSPSLRAAALQYRSFANGFGDSRTRKTP
ncbi:hypothetical protein BTO32_15445 [Marinobacter lutaoensis]|uniref:DUF1778 domain-containing protein n=1 Tax=Marinobacter lutaoensis TaxID=135739 RepID=A0A1V2DQ15_9GAMM|nr:DUF1778 domain-containing protein [Marinobacter lutaoensis]ONF42600.1 hypothetical protein BTO32_15445 [Marinobacter lutaoensis]